MATTPIKLTVQGIMKAVCPPGKGEDPAGEDKPEAKRERARLDHALNDYESDLERRKVVKRGEVMSLLRRELSKPLSNVELRTLTGNDLVKRIGEVEASGRPGAAKELRKVAAVFPGLVRRPRHHHRVAARRLEASAKDPC